MRIKKYRPAFFSGFRDEYYDIESKEQLLSSELCRWPVENGYEIAVSDICIIAVNKTHPEWWVLAEIPSEEDIETLRMWLPNFNELRKKLYGK